MESVVGKLGRWMIAGIIGLFVAAFVFRLAKGHLIGLFHYYRRFRISKTGACAPATIVEVTVVEPDQVLGLPGSSFIPTGPSGFVHETYRILLKVEPRMGEPFGADLYLGLSKEELDDFRPDSRINVMYDPEDTDIVVLGGVDVTLSEPEPPSAT